MWRIKSIHDFCHAIWIPGVFASLTLVTLACGIQATPTPTPQPPVTPTLRPAPTSTTEASVATATSQFGATPTATATPARTPTATVTATAQGRVVVAVSEYSVVEQVRIQRFPRSTLTPTAGYLFLIVKVRFRNNTAEEIQTAIDVSATHDGIALMGLREGRFYDVPTLDATGRGNTRKLSPDRELPNEIVAFEIPQNTDPKHVTLHFQIVWSVTQTTDITLN